mmetsp:Transcript_814/g.1649  ORF Transcript_814/g.1649 Transcript_814/m.1649 type:complete len:338 (+) Transcript_814:622-1635(+)
MSSCIWGRAAAVGSSPIIPTHRRRWPAPVTIVVRVPGPSWRHIVMSWAKVARGVLEGIPPSTHCRFCTVAIFGSVATFATSVTWLHIVVTAPSTNASSYSVTVTAIRTSCIAFCYFEEAVVYFVLLIWNQSCTSNAFGHGNKSKSSRFACFAFRGNMTLQNILSTIFFSKVFKKIGRSCNVSKVPNMKFKGRFAISIIIACISSNTLFCLFRVTVTIITAHSILRCLLIIFIFLFILIILSFLFTIIRFIILNIFTFIFTIFDLTSFVIYDLFACSIFTLTILYSYISFNLVWFLFYLNFTLCHLKSKNLQFLYNIGKTVFSNSIYSLLNSPDMSVK